MIAITKAIEEHLKTVVYGKVETAKYVLPEAVHFVAQRHQCAQKIVTNLKATKDTITLVFVSQEAYKSVTAIII